MALMLCASGVAVANPTDDDDDDIGMPGKSVSTKGLADPNSESWIGAEGFRNVWSLYSGATYAPFGSIRENGWRLRASGGTSGYRYTAQWFNPASQRAEPLAIRGQSTYGDLLGGYHWRKGPMTLKMFAGVTWIGHQLGPADGALAAPVDFNTNLNSAHWGGKVAAEFWLNVGRHAWTSLDLAFSTPHLMTSARSRTGWRVTPAWSLGPEVSIVGYRDHDAILDRRVLSVTQKLGAFVRYDNGIDEIALSGGWLASRGSEGSLYLSGQWLTRF
jgi:Cellulose biosynthesis protein BcsS